MRITLALAMVVLAALSGCSKEPVPTAAETPEAVVPSPESAAPVETPTPEVADALEPMPAEEAAAPAAETSEESVAEAAPMPAEDVSTATVDGFVGDYVDDAYAQRGEGYDWVAVTIEKIHDQEAYVKVRARGDRKRPTCTFDGVGRPTSENVLEVDVDGKPLVFALEGDTLTASVRSEDDEFLLYYPCSGGASLAGPYQKLAERLDMAHLAAAAFSQELSLQNVTFTITANDTLPKATFVVRPSGLEIDNSLVVQQIEGNITGAEIEDLNSDGWPEVVIYAQTPDPTMRGTVVGFSVNNGKSMSAIAVPSLEGEVAEGYRAASRFLWKGTRTMRLLVDCDRLSMNWWTVKRLVPLSSAM